MFFLPYVATEFEIGGTMEPTAGDCHGKEKPPAAGDQVVS